MKNILCYLSLLFITLTAITSCKKMDSTYEQFIVPGGITYVGKANNAKVQSGRNRVRISWPKSADPNIVKAKIFWNNLMDSVELDIPSTGDSVSQIIDNLEEKTYSFIIRTYDDKGHTSIPVEIISAAYGEAYQSNILNRNINVNKVNASGSTVNITWAGPDISNGAFATEILYTAPSGDKTIKVTTKENTTTITDHKPGTTYKYRTMYKPDSLSIDVFLTPYTNSEDFLFDKADWTIIDFSSQHPGAENSVLNAIDGTDATRWHSLAGGSSYPHHVTIDMGAEKTITKFGVSRTTFENGGDNRAPDVIEFLVSTDNVKWTSLGNFNFNRLINGEQVFLTASHPKARYFKLVGVQGPENNMVLGEISAYGL